MTGLLQKEPETRPEAWLVAGLLLALAAVTVYGWTVFEPFAGDALMHMMDDTQLHSVQDLGRSLLGLKNPNYIEHHRLTFFHRPIFNEWYLTAAKNLLGVGSAWLRVLTLSLLVSSTWIFLLLLKQMKVSCLPATTGAFWLLFSPPLFFGLYEFGLSFSQLLVFFALISLLSLHYYVNQQNIYRRYIALFVTLLCTVLIVFTKESAALWPFVLMLATLYYSSTRINTDQSKKLSFIEFLEAQFRVIKSNVFLMGLLPFITVVYFITRYVKLGSLTSGILNEQPISFLDSLLKLVIYVFYNMHIPTRIFPAHMSVSIEDMIFPEVLIRLFLASVFLTAFTLSLRRAPMFAFFIFAMIFLTFLPIIKVSRNSPYYGDLMSIPFALIVALGYNFLRTSGTRLTQLILFLGITCALCSGIFTSYRYIYDHRMWLALSQGYARAALSDFASSEGALTARRIVGTSGMFYRNSSWAINFSPHLFGSGFHTNLGIDPERLLDRSEKLDLFDNVLFIDFHPAVHRTKLGPGPLPAKGRLLSSYFPSGFSRIALSINENEVLVGKATVIRLSCQNQFLKPFVVKFGFPDGTTLSRHVIRDLILYPPPNAFVLEFVVPKGSNRVLLPAINANACRDPRVEGYVPLSLALSNASTFEVQGNWVGQLKSAAQGGAIVGPGPHNPTNMLVQRIRIDPSTTYEIRGRAVRPEGSKATISFGRLQATWSDADGRHISTSGRDIKVGPSETVHKMVVSSPENAAFADLFATHHRFNDIILYKEMVLLGARRSNPTD